jgi:hypothetical protein
MALDLVSGASAACVGSMKLDMCIEVYQNDWVPSAAMQILNGVLH